MGLLIGIGDTTPKFAYDYYYGIEWDSTVSNPKPTRIGKMELHKSLPLQSMMRRCILKDNGTVNYYLHANDSTKRDNGAAANLMGADGQYMVEMPDVYVRFETDGTKNRALISTQALPGFHLWRKDYISAVEATIQRSTAKLSAVVNTDADYRGGDNDVEFDGTYRTMLGMPATFRSLDTFRSYARKRGSTEWNCNMYQTHRKMWWLFAIEYANFNCQAKFNAELDNNGYRQGGLGSGVTTLKAKKWLSFNGYRPFIPCGTTNSLGNHSGVVDYTMPTEYDTTTTTVVGVPSYRGVENPFGHIWKWTDGCKAIVRSEEYGGLSEFYVCDEPENFTNSSIANYQLRGVLSRKEGYVKALVLGEEGEIMPLEVGGGSTTYFCDYFFTRIPEYGISEKGVLFGGTASNGTIAGFVFAGVIWTTGSSSANIGSRLCFLPQIEAA